MKSEPLAVRCWDSFVDHANRFAFLYLFEKHLHIVGGHLLGLFEHLLGIGKLVAQFEIEGLSGEKDRVKVDDNHLNLVIDIELGDVELVPEAANQAHRRSGETTMLLDQVMRNLCLEV